MKSASEVLAQGQALLLNFQPKSAKPTVDIDDFTRRYMEPPRSHKCFNVLAPPDFEWSRDIHDFYPGDLNNWSDIDTATTVIHGHPVGQVCQNRDLCHILGFKPDGTEHPWFLKEWRKFNYDENTEGDTG